ncbi:MAG: IPT/TIG domain-containing protein [Chloroflexota bacterium]
MYWKFVSKSTLSLLTVLTILFTVLWGGAQAAPLENGPANIQAPGDQLYNNSGSIAAGETIAPSYQLFSPASLNVNLKIQVTAAAGDNPVNVKVTDGSGGTAYTGTILDGETLWTNTTLKAGHNVFSLQNTGSAAVGYQLWVYSIPNAPFNWSGISLGSGTWNSSIQLNFPTSGLYTFTFGNTSGRYQFLVDDQNVQKTVEASGNVAYFIAAGVHTLRVKQDTDAGTTSWTLAVSAVGPANDTLPYTKSGGAVGGAGNDFTAEWLPLNLASASPANFSLTITGAITDSLAVALYAGSSATPFKTIDKVYGGETLWWTADLAAGTTRLALTASGSNLAPLSYQLNVQARPTVPNGWSGKLTDAGSNAEVKFTVATAGLYDFNVGLTEGRYQFLIDKNAAGAYIQKTVEAAGSVRYYLPAGNHTLTIAQDTGSTMTAWSLAIAATGAAQDSLPYTKSGGKLGGNANDFATEWLPIQLAAEAQANFVLALDGALDDGLRAYVYRGESLVYTSPLIYGGETFWWTAGLGAGGNHVKLVAEAGNDAVLQYTLAANAVPTPAANWAGTARSGAGNSIVQANIAAAGLYHVSLNTPVGFAQVQVDGGSLRREKLQALAGGHLTEFDIQLAAGTHTLKVVQDSSYVTTTWTLGLQAATAAAEIGHFAGQLDSGVSVDPQFPLPGSSTRKVNFRLEVPANGGNGALSLEIEDGSGASVFKGSILDGETLWGTATLKPLQNTFTLSNTSGVTLEYDLTIYEIGTAPYDWAGSSRDAGTWHSHILLDFPSAGLYTFTEGLTAGRYQFLVDQKNVQKTVEQNGSVAYYIPAGQHILTIVQDSAEPATNWTLNASAVGAAGDSLPYAKSGGEIGGTGNDFDSEWLPLHLAAASPANFALTLGGSITDSLDVALYAGTASTPFYTVTAVYGGETLWWSADLISGTNRIKLTAAGGNLAPLSYQLNVQARPATPGAWSGTATDVGNHAKVRFTTAADGLYDLNFGLDAGRYQFLIDGDHIQKTVEISGSVRYYLPAGNHQVTIVQDSDSPQTAWSLSIAASGVANDSLPYAKQGGNLGGLIGANGNDFDTEWLPVQLSAAAQANFALRLTGELADGLKAYVYQGNTLIYTSPVIYGGETFWWASELAAGSNRVKLVAEGSNAAPLAYDLEAAAIPFVVSNGPVMWGGVSKGTGGNAQVLLNLPVSGTYHVTFDYPSGFANLNIGAATAPGRENTGEQPNSPAGQSDFDVTLPEGRYRFEVVQSVGYTTTQWTATVSLKEAPAPVITSIDPVSVTNHVSTTLTINGANFQPGATVVLSGTVRLDAAEVAWLGSGQLQILLPAGLAAGVYTITVTNPDEQAAVLPDGLLVLQYVPPPDVYTVYLPVVSK